MNKVSNDFVTVEYNSDEQRKIAKYYIKLFNEEPDFYKWLLNGRTIIHGDELEDLIFTKERLKLYREILAKQNKETIVNSILRLGNSTQPHFYEPSMSELYYEIETLFNHIPSRVSIWQTYYKLGYYYYKLTNDSKYLKDYFYGDADQREQVKFIADFLVINMYDELLKEKLEQDRRRDPYKHTRENFLELMELIEYINNVSKEEYAQCDQVTKIPTITDEELRELIVGALNYIDPTNKLLKEYMQAEEEGRIIKKPAEEGKTSNCFSIIESVYWFKGKIKVSSGYGIELYKEGNLEDVTTFLHEFGHYHYQTNNLSVSDHNKIFSECSSIYYELKTLEFLETMGYSKQEILATKKMRLENNKMITLLTLPNLYCLSQNANKLPKECKSEPIKEYINYFVDNYIDDNIIKDIGFFKRFNEINKETKKLFSMYVSLLSKDEIIHCLSYIIGTYFSEYAIANLDHKNALKILNKMKTTKLTLDEVKNMLYSDTNSKENGLQYIKTKQV